MSPSSFRRHFGEQGGIYRNFFILWARRPCKNIVNGISWSWPSVCLTSKLFTEVLNANQGSSMYTIFQVFDMTRERPPAPIYRVQCARSTTGPQMRQFEDQMRFSFFTFLSTVESWSSYYYDSVFLSLSIRIWNTFLYP